MDTITDLFEKIAKLPPPVLVGLVVILLGYALRVAKVFPNSCIPLVSIIVGGAVYPFAFNHDVRHVLVGVVIAGIAWLFHNQVLKRAETKFGLLQDAAADVKPPTPPATT